CFGWCVQLRDPLSKLLKSREAWELPGPPTGKECPAISFCWLRFNSENSEKTSGCARAGTKREKTNSQARAGNRGASVSVIAIRVPFSPGRGSGRTRQEFPG